MQAPAELLVQRPDERKERLRHMHAQNDLPALASEVLERNRSFAVNDACYVWQRQDLHRIASSTLFAMRISARFRCVRYSESARARFSFAASERTSKSSIRATRSLGS